MIDFNILKSTLSIEHTEKILANSSSETLTYFIEGYNGTLYLDNFIQKSQLFFSIDSDLLLKR